MKPEVSNSTINQTSRRSSFKSGVEISQKFQGPFGPLGLKKLRAFYFSGLGLVFLIHFIDQVSK